MTDQLEQSLLLRRSEALQSDLLQDNIAQTPLSLAEFGDFIDAYFSLCNHSEDKCNDVKR
ncbi:hypothetical protein [Kurthia sibirica]|uniref:Uncharacterized protein n=1 Tax=Kurthia sibirica TaxID=202750 RepID=A0A2U3AP23_9BACL|nr:hypothetical protein [Kurthia sibirica]PWI26292.1 hypothetical protein DEX24_02860 [Kurthia sibirica]GEK35428.1 hypothetical protein KSI01_29610 [Kurthia sibirica]